ncbi:MAG: 5'/3'-nucleotidase SurE [Gammaproteobacteria bacterium]|nr:5'/3'-nucleotidase SurE [Gammaproteobacteria bacterium]
MHILLSNDDGCQAPGLRRLIDELRPHYELDIVAPDRNRSGASNSLTLSNPLRIQRHDDGTVCVDGTPTDCVHLALTGLLERRPDIVVSGINAGANLGDDTLYSGTVAAAMEGRHLGAPAIAISTTDLSPRHFGTAARVAHILIERLRESPLAADLILNVNVPDIPFEDLAGFRSTRLGKRHLAEGVVPAKDPRGRTIYWVGAVGPELDCGPGTDFDAIVNHFVSITPIVTDLTRHGELERVGNWLEALR